MAAEGVRLLLDFHASALQRMTDAAGRHFAGVQIASLALRLSRRLRKKPANAEIFASPAG
eukprot:6826012-Prorocentrum_lima.AAC.1